MPEPVLLDARSQGTRCSMRKGLAIPGGMDIPQVVDIATRAEAAGFHSVWVVESFADPFAILGACSVATTRLRLGTAAATIGSRSPLNLAISALTVGALSKGRFSLGLGVGHNELVTTRDKIDADRSRFDKSPSLTQLLEVVEIVREVTHAAFSGRTASFEGQYYQFRNYQPWFDYPPRELPILLASISPTGLSRAVALADGVLPIFLPVASVKLLAENIPSEKETFETAVLIPVCVSEDAGRAQDALARLVLYHITRRRVYQKHFGRLGFIDEVTAILHRWESGELAAALDIARTTIVDEIGIAGRAEVCRERVAEYTAAGATLPILYPVPEEFVDYQTSRSGYSAAMCALAV